MASTFGIAVSLKSVNKVTRSTLRMLDLTSIFLYCMLALLLLAMACKQPIWAVGFYMLNFFAHPDYWSWGKVFPGGIRWSLLSGLVLLVSVMFHRGGFRVGQAKEIRITSSLLLLYLVNATLVLILLSYEWENSWVVYIETAKFILLYFLVLTAVQTEQDFRWLIMFFVLGLLFWGVQAKIGSIRMIQGRLEMFGGPGCAASNELASIVVMLLPIIGAMVVWVRAELLESKFQFWLVLASAVGGLNVLLLCNSRGGFLGLIGAILTILVLAKGQLRRNAMKGLAYGSVVLFLLMGNPKIMERFLTIFQSREDARHNIQARMAYESGRSRIKRWHAARMMIRDHPVGSGGNSFQAGKGDSYMAKLGLNIYGKAVVKKSIHQGFLREACDWGIQGLLLHLSFITAAASYAWRAHVYQRQNGDASIAFMGLCIFASMVGFLITCFFSDLLHLEWGYWLTILAILYGRIYGNRNIEIAGLPCAECEGNVNFQ